jgi:hypothetical protein
VDPHDPDGSPDDPAGSPRHEPEDLASGTPSSPPPPGPPPVAPPGAPGGAWTPPDAAVSAAGPIGGGGIDIEVEDVDGPPVPPPVRRRRRRRRALLIGAIVVAVVVVIGVPLALVAGLLVGDQDEPSATAGDTPHDDLDDGGNRGEGQEGGGEGGDAAEDELGPLDIDALDGADAVYGRLLVDIDASEQVMVGFQEELATAFTTPPDARVEALQETAVASRDDLGEARDRLDEELEVTGAEEVRERYLAHLDSWADYMDAVAEDPSILGGEGAGTGFTVVINATADAFARALEDELPGSADASVKAYAENLLDRGFRPSGDAQV